MKPTRMLHNLGRASAVALIPAPESVVQPRFAPCTWLGDAIWKTRWR